MAKKLSISDESFKIYITAAFLVCFIVCAMFEWYPPILISLISYNVYIGINIPVRVERGEFVYHTHDKLSVFCCVFYNLFMVVAIEVLESITGKSSSFEAFFVYALTVLISIAVGSSVGKNTAKRKRSFEYYEYSKFEDPYEKYYERYAEEDARGGKSQEYYDRTKAHSGKVFTFFDGCKTKKEIKKRFKELSKKYHPDNIKTGDEKIFKQLKMEYDELMQYAY